MMSPTTSSEFERMKLCGNSVCTTTFGLRGSETSTAVKFFRALSCASRMMRRPSLAIWIDMPSPMPPKPCSSWWAMSLKFHSIWSGMRFLLRLLLAFKLLDCGFDSVGKRNEVALDDVPDHLCIDGVVFVPDGVTERSNVGPRL